MFQTKAQRIAQAQRELNATLARVGYKGKSVKSRTLVIELTPPPAVPTSDSIPDSGVRRKSTSYTGHEIAGVTLLHKQGYEPVRRDNLQAAKDAAQMRRS
jgi:hypothetical protein